MQFNFGNIPMVSPESEISTVHVGFGQAMGEVQIGYVTQADANAQGMPVIELGDVTSTSEVREVNGNFELISASQPRYYLQLYFNTSANVVTVNKPAGYLDILGDTNISSSAHAVFIKRANVLQFRRLG